MQFSIGPGLVETLNELELFNTQLSPSGCPVHTARTKALAITIFVSCILVLPAPVLFDMKQLQLVRLSECQ